METTPDRQQAARDYAEQALTTQDRLEAELRELRQRCATLYDAVAHGDDRHRAWLRAAVDAHMAGRPVPAVDGQGAREALAAEVRQLKDAHEHLLRRNAALVVQAQRLEQEAQEARRDSTVLRNDNEALRCENARLVCWADQLQASCDRIDALQEQKDRADARLTAISDQTAAGAEKALRLLGEAQAARQALQADIDEVLPLLDEAEGAMQALRAENEGLRRQVEELRRELVQTMREPPDA